MPKLLVIDDDRSVLLMVERAFAESTIQVETAKRVSEGLASVRAGVDVVLLDIMLPEISGLEAVRQIQALDSKLPVIFITAHGTSGTAIEATKLGAYEYVLKPLDLPKLKELVGRALEVRRLMRVPVALPHGDAAELGGEEFVGRSPPMQEVFKAIGRVAPQDVTVLIHGESGTGKELVARAIYHHGKRAHKRFLAVNCAAIPDSLLESELFGHEKGSFTSADQRRIGKFEQCDGGTIFLDEVGDMSPLVQSKVLRILQEQRFERVGGTETIQTDVRIIAATNRDLKAMAELGTFREDLYYRLNGFTISLPPLRERGDDVPLLLMHALRRFNREMAKDIQGFSPESMEVLTCYRWPGNVRELESVVRQTVLQTTGVVVLPEFLPHYVRAKPAGGAGADSASTVCDLTRFVEECLARGSEDVYAQAVELMERTVLTRVLQSAEGNQSRAARILGITRGSLRNKIRALGINLGHTVTLEDDGLVDEELVSDVSDHG